MGVFDDKKFEELDWISQTTEPIDSAINDVLNLIPETTYVDFKMYKEICNDSYYNMNISVSKILNYLIKTHVGHELDLQISSTQLNILDRCFKLEVEGEELILDFENKVISGGILKLVKTSTTMDEKVLESILGREGIESLHCARMDYGDQMSRCNEVMELLGNCAEGLKTRSEHRKRRALFNRLNLLFKNNEWNIKDTELANKVGTWIKDYITDGNLAAFSNFCRLKVMTHKGQPIYSMEEIV